MKVIFSALVFLLACTFATEALILPFNTRNVRRISTKTCSGSAELESYHGSRPRIIYNLKQNGLTDAIATRRMFTPPGRLMPTILRVTGNCCWELYQRYYIIHVMYVSSPMYPRFTEPIIVDPEKRSGEMVL